MPDFAVLLHATNVLIADDRGSVETGGMYTWRRITAPDPEKAGGIAARSLLQEEQLRQEIWNESLDEILVTAEEVELLDADDTGFSDSGYVFYLDIEEDRS